MNPALLLCLTLCGIGIQPAPPAPPAGHRIRLPETVHVPKPVLFTFAAAATADWVTTYQDGAGEANPSIAWLEHRSKLGMVLLGGAMDVAGTWLVLHKWPMAKRHPKLTTAGFLVAAALRGWLVYRNMLADRLCSRYEYRFCEGWRPMPGPFRPR